MDRQKKDVTRTRAVDLVYFVCLHFEYDGFLIISLKLNPHLCTRKSRKA